LSFDALQANKKKELKKKQKEEKTKRRMATPKKPALLPPIPSAPLSYFGLFLSTVQFHFYYLILILYSIIICFS